MQHRKTTEEDKVPILGFEYLLGAHIIGSSKLRVHVHYIFFNCLICCYIFEFLNYGFVDSLKVWSYCVFELLNYRIRF